VFLVATLATALATPASAGAVSFHKITALSFGGSTGYIAGGYSPSGAADGFVARTTDGGVTWSSKTAPGSMLVGVKTSADGARATTVRGTGFDEAFQTLNSGLTWEPFDPVSGYSVELNDAVYTATGSRIAVGKKQVNNYALIAASAGDGAVEELWSGPVPVESGDDEPPPTNAWFTSADVAPDGQTVWAAGNDFTRNVWDVLLRKSIDGGSTWTTPTALPVDGVVTDIVAPTGTTAYLAQRTNWIRRTFNGGDSWDSKSIVGGPSEVYSIDAIDANKVVVVGKGGRVSHSTNAATAGTPTWSAKTTGTTNNLNGVVMLDADSWIVVGDNETILRTDNSGTTWTGSRALGKPTVDILAPATGFSVDTATIGISGTSADPVNPPVTGRSSTGRPPAAAQLRPRRRPLRSGRRPVG